MVLRIVLNGRKKGNFFERKLNIYVSNVCHGKLMQGEETEGAFTLHGTYWSFMKLEQGWIRTSKTIQRRSHEPIGVS